MIIQWRNEASKYKPRSGITSFRKGIDNLKESTVWDDMYYNTGDRHTTMHIGDSGYVYKLNVQEYNEKQVPYYGFEKEFGHWIVVDANGRELNGDNALVVLTTCANV